MEVPRILKVYSFGYTLIAGLVIIALCTEYKVLGENKMLLFAFLIMRSCQVAFHFLVNFIYKFKNRCIKQSF